MATFKRVEEVSKEVFGVCPSCGRKRLDLKVKEYVTCEDCTNVMVEQYAPLYYLDDELEFRELGTYSNPVLYRRNFLNAKV